MPPAGAWRQIQAKGASKMESSKLSSNFSRNRLLFNFVAFSFCLIALMFGGCHHQDTRVVGLNLQFTSKELTSVGVLKISEQGDGISWTLCRLNEGRAYSLRSGTLRRICIDKVAKELVNAMASSSSNQSPHVYTVDMDILYDGGATASSQCGAAVLDQLSNCLPDATSSFATIWRDASVIPKAYWYRDVGPVDWANRAFEQPVTDAPAPTVNVR